MPEGAEDVVSAALIKKDINEAQIKGKILQGRLQIFPQTFSMGTDAKAYITCTADSSRYDESVEPIPDDYSVDPYDARRSVGEPFKYLLRPTVPGPLIVAARGKQLAIAAGHHLVTISWGLEASLIPMDTSVLNELRLSSEPGPNSNKEKAEALRQFLIPARFYEENTSKHEKRYVRICLAFITDARAYVVADFSRIVRFHAISRTDMWRKEDLIPGSEWWPIIWAQFPSGPDWVLETNDAISAFCRARERIISRGWTSTTIISYMDSDKDLVWAGFGRHLSNDFLAKVMIHPSTPVYVVFTALWDGLVPAIVEYMAQFRAPAYLNHIAVRSNNPNPFAFRDRVDDLYISRYVFVFRKQYTYVEKELHNRMVKEGLFCPTHTIGEPYKSKYSELCLLGKRRVPVIYYDSPVDAYTIICAKPPADWVQASQKISKDLRTAGYSTTIGPANFHEQKQNMLDPAKVLKAKGKPGRPKKIQTGNRGRPPKAKTLAEKKNDATRGHRVKAIADRMLLKSVVKEKLNPLSGSPNRRVTRALARKQAA
ncbi:hypothetical protein C8J56DRAFT_1170636 [Mycena floridula]|nr:hypothetical protein C8J56DRAFT_1173642 [Mycena floridula]KAJ7577797.1 hypothetical protein C8J56DRAFT_1170636 [Mycena floridula]